MPKPLLIIVAIFYSIVFGIILYGVITGIIP